MLAYWTIKLNVSDRVWAYRIESRDTSTSDILQTRRTYGHSICLISSDIPAGGHWYDGTRENAGMFGYSWLTMRDSSSDALNLFFYSSGVYWGGHYRKGGLSIRSIHAKILQKFSPERSLVSSKQEVGGEIQHFMMLIQMAIIGQLCLTYMMIYYTVASYIYIIINFPCLALMLSQG